MFGAQASFATVFSGSTSRDPESWHARVNAHTDERPTERPAGVGRTFSDFGILYASNGSIGWLFAVTGPVAIILAVGSNRGFSEKDIASWIFGVFFFNGLITLLFSWLYRQPLVFFWTIPGTVIVGPALNHLTFPEIVGAFYATGLLMLVLGSSGWVKRVMQLVPMPIVMGMVAGVFLRFGLELVRAVFADTAIVGPMVAIWLFLSAIPRLGRFIPPIIGALLVGAATTVLFGRFDATATLQFELIARSSRLRSRRSRPWSNSSCRSLSRSSSCRMVRASLC